MAEAFEKYGTNEHRCQITPSVSLEVMSDTKMVVIKQSTHEPVSQVITLSNSQEVEALIVALRKGLEIAPD